MPKDVKLVKHKLKSGKTSLYLSYYPYFYDIRSRKVIKSENLKLYLYTEPRNAAERRHNNEIEQLATTILCTRIVQIRNEEYGFLDKTSRDESFVEYFEREAQRRHSKWDACVKQFRKFRGGDCKFGELNAQVCKGFRVFLLTQAVNRQTGRKISQNSASGYMRAFRTVLKQAYIDKLLDTNLNDYFAPIAPRKTYKESLTMEEFKRLANTPCRYDVLRRMSIFAIFTGLRVSDLESLEWEHIVKAPDGGWCIRKRIVKSDRVESIFISDEALSWCGTRSTGKVFKGFKRTMTQAPLKQWLRAAGIDKPFTFHCFRHTAATLMITRGADIYCVKEALTHTNVQTTQIYAEVASPKKRETANVISLINS